MNNLLKNDEKLEDLQLDGLQIIQSKKFYRFTSDAVILANFVSVGSKDFLMDLGTGSGIIAILTAYKNKPKKVFGIELQEELADMARRSVQFNKLENLIEIINCDIKELQSAKIRQELNISEADVVVCNPPYKKAGTSALNNTENKSIARHEVALNMDELLKVVKVLLKYGGRFYVVYDSNRTAELISKLKTNNLEPKKIFFTQPSPDNDATLVFVEAVKGGKEGVKVLPVLITNDKDGKYLEKIKNLKF
ncbi:MAG: methyltransferase [Clostridia bacterium]|nr:methyltransferase [Clostridia bacterium]